MGKRSQPDDQFEIRRGLDEFTVNDAAPFRNEKLGVHQMFDKRRFIRLAEHVNFQNIGGVIQCRLLMAFATLSCEDRFITLHSKSPGMELAIEAF
jgi:hypothetical protein